MLYFEFLLYNVLNCVRNIHWQMFLKGQLLFPTKLSAIAKESLIPYNLTERAPRTTFNTVTPNANQIKQM